MAKRAAGRLLAVCLKDEGARETHAVGTIAQIAEDLVLSEGGHRVELDGQDRARLVTLVASDLWVAEAEPLTEGDPGDDWGTAVEALARYLHAHADLRSFLDQQRRSKEPMSWVNLACQHLPITATARQKLLDADAPERCLKIGRGLDALLRKEQELSETSWRRISPPAAASSATHVFSGIGEGSNLLLFSSASSPRATSGRRTSASTAPPSPSWGSSGSSPTSGCRTRRRWRSAATGRRRRDWWATCWASSSCSRS